MTTPLDLPGPDVIDAHLAEATLPVLERPDASEHVDFSKLAVERDKRMLGSLQGISDLCKHYTFGGSRCH